MEIKKNLKIALFQLGCSDKLYYHKVKRQQNRFGQFQLLEQYTDGCIRLARHDFLLTMNNDLRSSGVSYKASAAQARRTNCNNA